MKIDLIYVCYNRIEYTRPSLRSVLADPSEDFSLIIWDNASTDGTADYLKNEVEDPRVVDIVLSKENVGLQGAVNHLFHESSADLVGIIPNDFIVTPGWTRTIAQAHAEVAELGIVACWHFFPDEFDYEKAKHKIQRFGRHRIFRHPWTGGGAGLIKMTTVRECGLLDSSCTVPYLLRMALRGYVNGYYYPLIRVEHMDDVRSEYSRIHSMPFAEAYQHMPAYQAGLLKTVEDYDRDHRRILKNLLTGPYDPRAYVGWRGTLRRGVNKVKHIAGTLGLALD